jgi:hypothetical protein
MITLNDFSFLIVSAVNDVDRLRGVYQSIRSTYPKNEIVIIYENISNISMSDHDDNLIEVRTNERVYVSGGYNLALKHCTKKCPWVHC